MLKIKDITLDKKRLGLVISIAIILIGVIPLIIFTFYADPEKPYKVEATTLTSEDGTRIEALIYKPRGISHEGIVVGHGYCGNKQYMQPLCIELVKRGFTVVNIDFRGHGSSDGRVLPSDHAHRYHGLMLDMEAGIDYLEDLDEIEQIGLVGHSMGGHTAVITSEEHPDKIEATVSLGHIPHDDYDFEDISNLLVAIGQFEQTYTEEDALEFLEEYTGKENVKVGEVYGDFDDGDACKVVIGEGSEHLAGNLNPTIVREMVQWFELAFNGEKADDVELTLFYTQLFYRIALIGVICLIFVLTIYFSNYLFKNQLIYPEKGIIKDISIKKLCIYYLLGLFIAFFILLEPLNLIFSVVTPIKNANTMLALLVGSAISTIIIYYFLLKRERLGFRDIPSKFKLMCSSNPKLSLLYGIGIAILYISSITAISHWSNTATIPTIREYLMILYITALFFPFILVKEFYFRIIQGRLNEPHRLKEYFKMTGLGIILDNILFVPIMLILWGSDFLALALTVVILFSIIQQILVTWVYMHSGRNILGSTLFLCIFYAWMIINFYPFEYI
jgi:pimeloyl-ACP methyl ester carboxylesterase